MFRRPASICFSEVNDVFVPGLIARESDGFAFLDCAFAEPNTPTWAAAMVMAAVRRKLRRLCLVSSDNLSSFIAESPWFDGLFLRTFISSSI
jgi:hypothetical protein